MAQTASKASSLTLLLKSLGYDGLMKNLSDSSLPMNTLDGRADLDVFLASQLSREPAPCSRPVLVTQIEGHAHLQRLAEWISAQGRLSQPLTLISMNGQTFTRSGSELLTLEDSVFPLQVYISSPIATQEIALQSLTTVVAQLRNPDGGCPWDLAQTPETLIPYIIEEAYETVDAIRQGEPAAIAEELGDLLLQVVLQSQIASESQQFSLTEVAEGITAKLIRRHPHVFGELQIGSVEEVHTQWEKIKAAEKGETDANAEVLSYQLQRSARRLPPLMAGLKLSEKAAAAGFEWPDMEGVWAKFYEELSEFQEALLKGDPVEQEAELGDLLFTLINIARWCEVDPAAALHQTNLKLIERIRLIESKAEKPLSQYTLEDLEQLWQAAKQQIKAQRSVETAVVAIP
jgi:XTP/dITP diphosphohydrolase